MRDASEFDAIGVYASGWKTIINRGARYYLALLFIHDTCHTAW